MVDFTLVQMLRSSINQAIRFTFVACDSTVSEYEEAIDDLIERYPEMRVTEMSERYRRLSATVHDPDVQMRLVLEFKTSETLDGSTNFRNAFSP